MSCNEGGGAPWTPMARLDHSPPLHWCSSTAKGSSNAFTSYGSCEDASVASHVRRGLRLTARVLVNSGLHGRWLPSSSSLTASFVRPASQNCEDRRGGPISERAPGSETICSQTVPEAPTAPLRIWGPVIARGRVGADYGVLP